MRKQTVDQYQRKLEASIKTMEFMGTLLPHYSAEGMTRMWKALGIMTNRYGIEFIADSISKSRSETELALQEVRV